MRIRGKTDRQVRHPACQPPKNVRAQILPGDLEQPRGGDARAREGERYGDELRSGAGRRGRMHTGPG